MELGSILLLFALLVLVVLFIARPILERKESQAVSPEEHALSALLAERDRAITALQELEFDYALGKIPEEDYPTQRAVMLRYGAEVLRKLDILQPQLAQPPAEERLEQAVARRAAHSLAAAPVSAMPSNGGNGNSAPDDALEALIAQRRRQRQGKAAGFCHQCGSPLQQHDRFCNRCGHKVD